MATGTQIQVELTGVHLCCQGCVNAANAALRSVDGVGSRCDMENRTVTVTADDDETARRALDALAAAGFYGRSGNPDLAMKPVCNVPDGKVKGVEVSGIHNCCGPCCEAIKGAIATVDGVTGDTAEAGATTFEVTGDFHAAALVEALNAAGFSARVT
jgi:mercuric ion binding protein